MSDTFVSGAPVPPQGPRPQASQSQQPKRPKKPHPGLRSLLFGLLGGVIGAAAVVAVLVVGGFVAMPSSTTSGKTGSTGTTSSSQTVTVNSGDSTDTTLANAVAQKALPSVVSINVTTSDGEGVGSGVVLDTDGNIVTNYHVIEGAQSISVSTGDASYDATVVGSDESSDLAVIKIDAGDAALTPIEVGDSSTLQVGDWVMSLGSPFGLEQSVSTGIVSSLYRSTMLQNTSGNTIYTNLIQTDATINPGNSGGALVDDEGKLVGINSLIESYSGSSSGVGFAIPGNYAVEVAQKLIAGQTVTHAYIGGSFQTVTANNARSNSLSVNQGAYVAELADDGPAAQAGIQKGDVITALDDEEITSSDALVLAVRSHSVGDTVTVTLMRGSKQMQVQVTLGSDEALQQQQDSDSSSQGSLLEQYLEQYGQQRGGSEDGYSRR
ncbi:S1C family serine protease [Parolsenella catena]|uniref:S1C family serine protease n=1 Tax=Parolsenella catena TaxID=2003188 RepID=UPI001899B30C|nr:trypsin-like peptidase domain-containing protein [Parolsenella catena]